MSMKDENLSVTPFVGKGSNTSMFYATTIQLGPAGVVDQPDVESKRPYYGFARVGHGQTAGSHFHDGYSLLMFTEGEYEIAGETYGAGTVTLIEPRVPTGECVPGREGVTELYIYDSGYCTIPFFQDLADSRTVELYESFPALKERALSRPRPPADPSAKAVTLDRSKHGRKGRGVTLYTCQIGPAGFGASPDPRGTRPFALLLEFEPGTVVPAHSHSGWSSLVIFAGSAEVNGLMLQKENSVHIEPDAEVALKIGDRGASMLRFFDTEAAAMPRFANPADAASFPLI